MLRIKELRAEKDITQRELAEKINSTSKNIWAYENNVAIPPLDVLTRLADFFDCSIDYVSGRSDDVGNATVYRQTEDLNSLTAQEQKIIDVIRKTTPTNANEWITMYAELPRYMQESIFAELKGMYLGYSVSKSKKLKEGV